MKVSEALNSRYSCRAFLSKPVSREILTTILAAAARTPSWADTQPWEVFVAAGKTLDKVRRGYLDNFHSGAALKPDMAAPKEWPDVMQQRIAEMGKLRFKELGIDRDDKAMRQQLTEQNLKFFNAPAVMFLCLDRSLTTWSMYDLGAFGQSIMLAAREYDLDTMTAFVFAAYPEVVRREVGVPEHLSLVVGIAVGYGDREHPQNQIRSPRRPIEDFAVFKDI